jgi:hypothetical protein
MSSGIVDWRQEKAVALLAEPKQEQAIGGLSTSLGDCHFLLGPAGLGACVGVPVPQ